MDGGFKGGDQQHPLLLDLIPEEKIWMDKKDLREGGRDGYGVAEERKLELRLGPPGEQWLSSREKREEGLSSEPRLSLLANNYHPCVGTKRGGFVSTEVLHQQQRFLQSKSGSGKELSQKNKGKEEHCPPPPPPPPHGSQTRVVSTPVVGWPPVRSFRRNLASSSSKLSHESRNGDMKPSPKVEPDTKGLFVKINMDGIPIGRKVDLKAYDSYEKLSLAVDKLFQGLIAGLAQRGTLAAGDLNGAVEMHALTGLLEGNCEYTLVYEDDEGDRMLVGDVPWDMFISTAKRLRVLKSSDLSALSLGARKKNSNRVLS